MKFPNNCLTTSIHFPYEFLANSIPSQARASKNEEKQFSCLGTRTGTYSISTQFSIYIACIYTELRSGGTCCEKENASTMGWVALFAAPRAAAMHVVCSVVGGVGARVMYVVGGVVAVAVGSAVVAVVADAVVVAGVGFAGAALMGGGMHVVRVVFESCRRVRCVGRAARPIPRDALVFHSPFRRESQNVKMNGLPIWD